MKKRIIGLAVVLTMLLTISAYAASERTIDVVPDINFDGTTATCTVQIAGDRTTDKIVATVGLWQGSAQVAEWSATGYGILRIEGTATVAKNRTYKLKVDYSINGEEQTSVSISRTNS